MNAPTLVRLLSIVSLTALVLSACSGVGGEPVGTASAAITPIQGCDTAGMPSPSSLASMGYQFVCRYVSGGSGKDITASEAQSLQAAGLDIVTNWETSGLAGTDVSNPEAQGVSDATAANQEAASVGAPATRPIYFSVDFDADSSTAPAVNAYFQGVASVIGIERTGAYGGYYIINELFDEGLIKWGWQTYAWSNGAWDSRAQLQQYDNGVDNGELDADRGMVADYGQWGPGAPTTGDGGVSTTRDAGVTTGGGDSGGEDGVGVSCTVSATGEEGVCLETSSCATKGGTSTPDYCPGPDNVQCCTGLRDAGAKDAASDASSADDSGRSLAFDAGSTTPPVRLDSSTLFPPTGSGSGGSESAGGSESGSGGASTSSDDAGGDESVPTAGCGVAPGDAPSGVSWAVLVGLCALARRRRRGWEVNIAKSG
jgi:MYXO-CTERM domain-containing protein